MRSVQSRIASLIASLSEREPASIARTFAPKSFIRWTLGRCRSTSCAPMKTSTSRPSSAPAIAVATPCCPAPVSAISRRLPMHFASSA